MYDDDYGYEPYEDDLNEWETEQVFHDHEGEDDLPSDAFDDWRDDAETPLGVELDGGRDDYGLEW